MSKYYHIEAQLQKSKWELIKTFTKHTDALGYIKDHASEMSKYPLRIVRVERKTVFESK